MMFDVQCPRCGKYQITRWLAEDIDSHRERFEAVLPFVSAHTRQSSARGTVAVVTHDNYEAIAAGDRNTPVAQKLRTLLDLCTKLRDRLRGTVAIPAR